MKNILFATTALVATAGIAAAETSISGYAEMGVIGGSGGMETQFHHDFDVKFSLSGETDNGLTFGATIDLDEVSGGISNTSGPHSVFMSGNFGKLTMGDTDGAFDWAMQEVGINSAIADDHTTHGGFNFNSGMDGNFDGQVLRYDNTFGDFAVSLSAELASELTFDAITPGTRPDDVFGVGLKYNLALGGVDLGLGVGYQDGGIWTDFNNDGDIDPGETSSDSAVGVSIDAKFAGGFRVILNYADLGDTDAGGIGEEHMGIGIGYSAGNLSVAANYGIYDEGANEQDGWGIAANLDMGGGAVLMAGFGDTTTCGVYGGCALASTWSLGWALSF